MTTKTRRGHNIKGRVRLSYTPPEPDYAGLIAKIGTDHVVSTMLFEKTGQMVPDNSINGWRLRNSVPASWVPTLIEIGVDKGVIKGAADIMKRSRW